MNVDIRHVLETYRVDFIERGPNVKKGELNVKCPLCMHDPSHHMGINLETGKWGCWRDRTHRGKSLRFLFAKLLKVPGHTLDQILGAKKRSPLSDLRKRMDAAFADSKAVKPAAIDRNWPPECVPITDTTGPRRRALAYLRDDRKYGDDAEAVAKAYDLRCSAVGRLAARVLFPIVMEGRRIGWTGRDITGESERRYFTDDGGLGKDVVYAPRTRKTIIIVEGPFDALRLNWTAKTNALPICSWALLGTSVTAGQIRVLNRLIPKNSTIVVCFDAGAGSQGLDLMRSLSIFRPKALFLPEGISDPDGLQKRTNKFLRDFLSKTFD